MTKSRFIRIHTARGYHVQDLGNIVIVSLDGYSAIWFFHPDGTQDATKPPQWLIRH